MKRARGKPDSVPNWSCQTVADFVKLLFVRSQFSLLLATRPAPIPTPAAAIQKASALDYTGNPSQII